ncbi:MAG TPA: hypothetical protein VFC21_06870 [Bryobacteraceae bacterium]|nr:hypothetical protein [Bryobacteraceae bacterium]
MPRDDPETGNHAHPKRENMAEAEKLADGMLADVLLMDILRRKAEHGECITADTILSALEDERRIIIRNLEVVSGREKTARGYERTREAKAIIREMRARVYGDIREQGRPQEREVAR